MDASAQTFNRYYLVSGYDRFKYRNYWTGINVIDTSGIIKSSEAIFDAVCIDSCSDYLAASIPIASNKGDFHQIWLCLNKELTPIFIFPFSFDCTSFSTKFVVTKSNCFLMYGLLPYSEGLFLQRVCGAFDFYGNAIFEPEHAGIASNGDIVVAFDYENYLQLYKDVTVTIRISAKRISDGKNLRNLKIKIPSEISHYWLLGGELPDHDKKPEESQLSENGQDFEQALKKLSHWEVEAARTLFLNIVNRGNDKTYTKLSKYNLKQLSFF